MLVNVDAGTVTLFNPEGVMLTLPYEPLDEKAMMLQAQYHLFLRHHDYRRELVCRRCKKAMAADTNVNHEEQAWEMMAHCECRALYGKVPMSRVPLSAARSESKSLSITPAELAAVVAYEKHFLKGRDVAEKMYCDACFRENRNDGCRVSVTENGFSGIVRIHCRCRTLEHKGMTH